MRKQAHCTNHLPLPALRIIVQYAAQRLNALRCRTGLSVQQESSVSLSAFAGCCKRGKLSQGARAVNVNALSAAWDSALSVVCVRKYLTGLIVHQESSASLSAFEGCYKCGKLDVVTENALSAA